MTTWFALANIDKPPFPRSEVYVHQQEITWSCGDDDKGHVEEGFKVSDVARALAKHKDAIERLNLVENPKLMEEENGDVYSMLNDIVVIGDNLRPDMDTFLDAWSKILGFTYTYKNVHSGINGFLAKCYITYMGSKAILWIDTHMARGID